LLASIWIFPLPSALCQSIQTSSADGIPTHTAVEAHEYEIIDLTYLKTTINIPILDKKGPIPFSYALRQQTYLGALYSLTSPPSLGGRLMRGVPLFTPFSLGYSGQDIDGQSGVRRSLVQEHSNSQA
jgi:hypothetical protein